MAGSLWRAVTIRMSSIAGLLLFATPPEPRPGAHLPPAETNEMEMGFVRHLSTLAFSVQATLLQSQGFTASLPSLLRPVGGD